MHSPMNAIPLEMKQGEIETRGLDWGGTTVRVVDLPAGIDFTRLLAGLADDLCQCPHWGFVQRGSMHVRYADGTEEVTGAGELYYWPGGHTGWSGPDGVTFIEFSPTEDITPVLTHLAAQMAAL